MRANNSKRNARPTRRARALTTRAPKPARSREQQHKPKPSRTAGRVALINSGSVPRALAKAIAQQTRLLSLNQVEPIGQLVRLQLAGKPTLDFSRTIARGPVVGRAQDGTMIVLTPFDGELPDTFTLTDQLCSACRVKCDECEDGLRHCQRCGRDRQILAGTIPCPECYPTGPTKAKAKKSCKACKGAGEVKHYIPCPAECDEEGKQRCPLCHGSGKMATGFEGGAEPPKGERALAKPCSTCHGRRFALQFTPQPLKKFLHKRYEKKYVAIGPIVSFTLQPLDAESPGMEAHFDVIAEPSEMQLIVQPGRAQSQMFLIGGRARQSA